MAVNEQTKVCPLCAETIKAAAKVCPHCRRSQRRWAVLTRFDLAMIVTFLLFISSIVLVIWLTEHGRTFTPIRDRIEVLSSLWTVKTDKLYTNIMVVGVVSNSSPYAWNVSDMEVRFFDRNGKLTNAAEIWGDHFTILPDADHAFRFYLDRKSVPEHASYKISVRKAYDPKWR